VTDTSYPGAYDDLVPGVDGSQRDNPSLASVINAIQQVLGLEGDYNFGTGIVESVVAGTNVTVDDTDPANPVVSAAGGGGGYTSLTGPGQGESPGSLTQEGGLTVEDPENDGIYLLGADGNCVLVLQPPAGESTAIQLTDYAGGGITVSSLYGDVELIADETYLYGDVSLQLISNAIFMETLPTSDPLSENQLWNNNGVVAISAGALVGGIPVVDTSFTADAYTLVEGDANTAQVADNGGTAATITVPPSADVAFPVGTMLTITQTGSGTIQLAEGVGVTILSSVSGGFISGTTGCRAENSTVALLNIATDEWVLSGDAA
jgi:hypothetical protein